MFSHDLFCQYRTSGDLSNEESHLDQYCQMFCILLEQTQFQCSHMTCFCQYRTSRDLSNEESHLDQYCQMFCILLEQPKIQCSHTTCLVSADPDETSQMRGLTWISTVRCSAYCLNKFISNFSHYLFGHCRSR